MPRDPGVAERLESKLEVPMIVISLAVIPALYIEHAAATPGLATAAWLVNLIIWMAFVAEYTVMLWVVPDRWGYTRRHWLDVLIILVSPPFLVPEAMAGLRALRALRVFRLLRTARVARVARAGRAARILVFAGRGLESLGRVFRKNSMHYVVALTLLLTVAAGTLMYLVEGDYAQVSLGDGLWWAIATMTTVGYGDVAPVTVAGRAIAVVVMVLGIGFVALLTANIAAWFVERDQENSDSDLAHEVRALRAEVAALRVAVTGQREAAAANDAGKGWADGLPPDR